MTFKTDVDGGYKAGFLCFLLFTGIFIYFTVTSFSVPLLVLAIIFSLMLILLLVPMYFSMRYILEEDGLRIKVGWFANRFFPYSTIFGFQRVLAEAKNSYGLSTRKRIAIYLKGTGGGYDVVTITPKNEDGFVEAFTKQTGIEITPPDPTFREIQDEYNAKTSEAQRRAARRRLKEALSKGYDKDLLEAETPETLKERAAYNEEAAAAVEDDEANPQEPGEKRKRTRPKDMPRSKPKDDEAERLRQKLAAYQESMASQEGNGQSESEEEAPEKPEE
jgi:hypothetical protein